MFMVPERDVNLHCPIVLDPSDAQNIDDKLRFKPLVVNTTSNTYSCVRIDANQCSFQPFVQSNSSDLVLLKYNKVPPTVASLTNRSEQGTDTEGRNSEACETLWCMSAPPKKDNFMSQLTENSATSSPTDLRRYKTEVILRGTVDEWKLLWRNLKRSLQNGHLEYCNAYCEYSSHIMIYHYGWQQAMVGEWIWKNVKGTYSKKTLLIPIEGE